MATPDPIKLIHTLIKLGNELRERYRIYTNSASDLSKLDSQLDVSLFVLETFQAVIQTGARTLLVRQQHRILRLMEHLEGVFDRLDKQLSRFPREATFDFVGKVRWTFGGKSGYEGILQEMREWQRDLRDVIEVIKLLQPSDEERALYKRLFELGGKGVRHADTMDDVLHERIAPAPGIQMDRMSVLSDDYSDGDRKIARLETDPHTSVYVEYRYLETRSPNEIAQSVSDVRNLASVLSNVDMESMHMLRCIGTVYEEDFNRSLLLYNIPSAPEPTVNWTLSKAIADDKKPSLEIRVRYAVEICVAVMFTHSSGLVHKSIRPQNVLVLPADDSMQTVSTFLVGFEAARLRNDAAYSAQMAETDPENKVYHHPERHGPGHVVRFGIRHDMYSLGVVLMELGMWKPLRRISKQLRKLTGHDFDANQLQEALLGEANQNLGGEVGPKYATAVVCCLEDTGRELGEREMRELFYDRVLRQLKQIVV